MNQPTCVMRTQNCSKGALSRFGACAVINTWYENTHVNIYSATGCGQPTTHADMHMQNMYTIKKIYQTYRVLISYIHTRTCGFERKIEIYTCSVCYASTGKTRKEPQGQGPRGQHTVTDCHEGQPSLGVGGSTRMSREDMHGEIRDTVPAGDLTRWLAHARPPGARELAL